MNIRTVEDIFEDNWDGFHDAIVQSLDIAPSKAQAVELFSQLPEHLREKAFQWGLSDSEVRDESYQAIKELGLTINTDA
ncbi:hypothetical protein [Microbulbifer epialgicus]|uniref:Uncharacterized protein n=1 Tax=Microbulbifer epialgicus TaxID=393907 RepID=A0ABV4NU25_9GAMM